VNASVPGSAGFPASANGRSAIGSAYPLIASNLTEVAEPERLILCGFERRELTEILEIERSKVTEVNPNCKVMQLIDKESEEAHQFRHKQPR